MNGFAWALLIWYDAHSNGQTIATISNIASAQECKRLGEAVIKHEDMEIGLFSPDHRYSCYQYRTAK